MPGGWLTSKPTWSNALGCSITPAFFVSGAAEELPRPSVTGNDQLRAEGKTDQAVGKAKTAVAKVVDKAKKAVNEALD